MNMLPITIKELAEILDASKTSVIDFSILSDIAKKSNGNTLNAILNVNKFNKMFDDINNGFALKAIGQNTSVNIMYASTSEVASDDFRAIELAYIHNGTYTALTLSKFSNDIFLDNKVVKTM